MKSVRGTQFQNITAFFVFRFKTIHDFALLQLASVALPVYSGIEARQGSLSTSGLSPLTCPWRHSDPGYLKTRCFATARRGWCQFLNASVFEAAPPFFVQFSGKALVA